MKYLPIDSALFIENRQRLTRLLKPNSLVILNSNDIMPTNADGTMRFVQNSDLFYLTGIDQEESILLLFPDFPDENFREILLLRETNEEIAIWEGHKYTKEEATQTSGIEKVVWLSQFDRILSLLMSQADHVYLNTNERLRGESIVQTRDARFIQWCQDRYPLHQYERVAPLLYHLRAVKSTPEIDLLQKACNITEQGFRRVLSFVESGVMEYEIEAEYLHEFVRNRSRGFAYEPIVASGANACVLHYIDNNQPCQSGDLILMDVGAEYANYNADMTRTIPANGRFTDRQKAVYNAVLRVMKEAIQLLQPGQVMREYHQEVSKIMESELIGLGLLSREEVSKQDERHPLYKKYYMHGTSHHLGLDVHDVGNVYRTFEPGMVFTVEPGIYIREEKLGIRLENNFVIQKNGILDLMQNIPIEIDEIETLMHEK
uniref:Xaa-Pro aminopeptidase n=1 Tax=Roseihalotalea indica TaxID=2867963 RepID=A0AA49GQG9_9BACT|nr:aminopeptidase P family protein [Tunicatimonas sp. TK19036]